MPNVIDPLAGFTLKDLISKDGLDLQFGEEFNDEEDDRYKFNPQANFTDDELVRFMNLELSDDEDDDNCDHENEIPMTLGANFDRIKAKMDDVTPDGKVKKMTRKAGAGDVIPTDSLVTVKYSGYFEGQDEPYDSSHMRGAPDKFNLATGGILVGLDIAIRSMCKHEVSIFWIHSDYAFGEMGCPPRIPPSADVIFIVQLIDIMDSINAELYDQMAAQDRKAFKNVAQYAKYTMTTAADYFKKGQLHRAIRDYKHVTERLEDAQLENDEEEAEMKQLLTRAYQNLAVCFNKENLPRQACIACNAVPNKSVKTYYNYGRALIKMGEYTQALSELEKALKLSKSDNSLIVKEIKLANELNTKYATLEKQLWSNCLGIKAGDNAKVKEYEDLAKDMCKNFLNNPNILRQPLPEGLTSQAEKIIRQQAVVHGISVTTQERYGKEIVYLHKSSYK